MFNANRFLAIILLVLFVVVMGSCGGGGEGSSSGDTTGSLKISGPISNPPAVLGEEQTVVTISTYVSGSYVELQKSDGVNFFKIGEMKDDGQNGDQSAEDKVYTIQTTINESVANYVTLRILASSNGEEKTSTITIPVVQIPSNVSDTELNQMADDLYQTGLETQALMTAINTDLDNVPLGTIKQLGNDLLSMFSDFETITKQDFFGLFNLAKDAKSLRQQLDIFSENPFDSRVSSVRQGVVSSGCLSEVDLEIVSSLERKLCARYYLFNSELNPDGEGVQLLKNAQKVTIRSLFSEATSLIGDGIAELFSLSFLGSILVDETLNTGTGIVVDWYIDDNGEENILIGQAQDNEEFTVPSGTHNILYSFGDDTPKAIVQNIPVVSQETTTVDFLPHFGTFIGEFNGVAAYSNGTPEYYSELQNYVNEVYTGIQWQCVEYARRYYLTILGKNIYIGYTNASEFYDRAAEMGLGSYPNSGTTSPQIGDILVSKGGSFGHVAIVRSVSDTEVCTIQQNWSNDPTDANKCIGLTVSNGNYTVSDFANNYSIQGWLRMPVSTPGIILQPSPTAGMDVWITSYYSYDDDYGVDNYELRVGGWGDWYYALIEFDLTGLPLEATSVELQLYMKSTNSGTSVSMYIDRVDSPWDENTGWFNKPTTTYISTLPEPTVGAWYSIDITNLYDSWQAEQYPNYGIQLRPTATDNRFNEFYSSDYMDDPSLRPKLVVIP